MELNVIHNIIQFMLRASLSGEEVPAFNEAMQALHRMLEQESLEEPE